MMRAFSAAARRGITLAAVAVLGLTVAVRVTWSERVRSMICCAEERREGGVVDTTGGGCGGWGGVSIGVSIVVFRKAVDRFLEDEYSARASWSSSSKEARRDEI